MQFAQPDSLWLLLLLIPIAGSWLAYVRWRKSRYQSLGHLPLLRQMTDQVSRRRQWLRDSCFVLALGLLCLAVAQPQWGETNRPIKRTGVDLVFALDLSQSMLARDVSPDRLNAARKELKSTMQILSGDRVGLVVFTAISFQQSPLTTDYGAIRFYLDKLAPEQMPMGGTSLGRAISDSVELLVGKSFGRSDASSPEMKRSENAVIVLITDGEDHESDPVQAARLAAENGIRVVTVGIGSSDGERIPIFREDGTLTGYKRDKSGDLVRSKLDEASLKRIASESGGTYLHYTGPNSVANGIVDFVNKLEKSEIESLLKDRYRERFMVFLVPALILLVIGLALGDRRRRKREFLGILSVLVIMGAFGCDDAFQSRPATVESARELLDNDRFEEALVALQQAESDLPPQSALHYNLGLAHLGLQDYSQAREFFARSLESSDPILRFDAHYNLGLALAGLEEWKESYASFKDALKLAARSDAISEERTQRARANLEIAFRHFWPPCHALEDEHEPNDTPSEAANLSEPTVEDLALCGGNDDWFAIPALAGATVSVKAEFSDLRDEPDPESVFLPAAEDLKIELFDHSGTRPIAEDDGVAEASGQRKAHRSLERIRVDESFVGSQGPLLLRVSAQDKLEFNYTLEIETIPPCAALQEESEPNDTFENAAAIDPGRHEMHMCPDDRDLVRVSLDQGETLFVDVRAGMDAETESIPALELNIVDSTGRILAKGTKEGPFITAGVREYDSAGDVFIDVIGTDAHKTQGPYTLDIYTYGECPEGDDRYEENDDAGTAAQIQEEEDQFVRYLRLCEGNDDFFEVQSDLDRNMLEIGLAPSAFESHSSPDERRHFTLDLMDPTGRQIIQNSTPVESVAEDEIPVSRFLSAQTDEETGIVRVSGEPGFYHLILTSAQESSDDQEQDEDQDSPEEENDESNEEQDESEQEDETEQEEEEDSEDADDSDDSNDSEGEESDTNESDRTEEPEDESEAGDSPEAEDDERSDLNEAASEEQAEANEALQISDILEALEQEDDNFQMRKALEDTPARYIERDW